MDFNPHILTQRFSHFSQAQYRPGQLEAIRYILTSPKPVTVLIAPTGSGKSIIGMCSMAHHPRASYLCSSRQLQAQITTDFPEAKLMMGRSNFQCDLNLHLTCAECVHTKLSPCVLKHITCEYEQQKQEVLKHPLQILNYSYLLYEGNYVGKFSDYPLIICDEADTLESKLAGFVNLTIPSSLLQRLNITPPARKTATSKDGVSVWQAWAKKIKSVVETELAILKADIMEGASEDTIKLFKRLESFVGRLRIFLAHVDQTWLYQQLESRYSHRPVWTFQPVWLTPALTREYFWRHGQKHVLMSATMPPKPILAQLLGLSSGDIDVIEIDSTFPACNRPVLLKPVADMSRRTFDTDLPHLLAEIAKILTKHRHERGVIHTKSWRIAEAVMGTGNPRLITHQGQDKHEALTRFKQQPSSVWVSPSSERGLDLPDDQCRFIIIAKAPYESLADKLVSSRVYGSSLGKYWYKSACAQDIVQASGRGVRHEQDYCVTYLLDKQIELLLTKHAGLFPRYWKQAVDYA